MVVGMNIPVVLPEILLYHRLVALGIFPGHHDVTLRRQEPTVVLEPEILFFFL